MAFDLYNLLPHTIRLKDDLSSGHISSFDAIWKRIVDAISLEADDQQQVLEDSNVPVNSLSVDGAVTRDFRRVQHGSM